MLQKLYIAGFISLFFISVCIMPATQRVAGDTGDLRAAVTLAKKLSSQGETTCSDFATVFTTTIGALRHLSSFELSWNTEDTDKAPVGTITLSSQLIYLLTTHPSHDFVVCSYDVNHRNINNKYTSIFLSPEVPPPNYS